MLFVLDRDAVRVAGVEPEVTRLGFDLDLTLIDTRDAIRFSLAAVNRTFDNQVDIEAMVARLGPPLRPELARYLPEAHLDEAIDIYRAALVAEGVSRLTPLPGAQALFDEAHRSGDLVAVITAKLPSTAQPCLDACELRADHLIGNVVGHEKAPGIRELDLHAFVGDHPLDMEAAQAAGVPGIGVTTGHHGAQQLLDAGAHVVVPSLNVLLDRD